MANPTIYSYSLKLYNGEEDVKAHLATIPNLKEYLVKLIRADIANTPDSPAHAILKKFQEKRIAELKAQIEQAQKELETMYP